MVLPPSSYGLIPPFPYGIPAGEELGQHGSDVLRGDVMELAFQ
jgi:hypothetical protein